MRMRKLERCTKRQRGQFMTPHPLAAEIVRAIGLRDATRILEPSCGTGSFVAALLSALPPTDSTSTTPSEPCELVGIEIDSRLLDECRGVVSESPQTACSCTLIEGDFFRLFMRRFDASIADHPFRRKFDLIIGNPPFGGSLPPDIEDELDSLLGVRGGEKIKKETYAFFIIACLELLRPGGRLVFVCSDSLLTIPTMTGLRKHLMKSGRVTLHPLAEFSQETNYPMLVLEYEHHGNGDCVDRAGVPIHRRDIEATPNASWGITPELAPLFRGPKVGDCFVATSGMTTGKNEYFVRELQADGTFDEPYEFRFIEAPVTVEYERERARLNRIPAKRLVELREAERRGVTERRVLIERRATALQLTYPHADYAPYNKAISRVVYSPTTHLIYWSAGGDAVLTYKRTGNWYLRGVGGQPFFGREGVTWPLVASRFNPRYLPPGCILDSGSPCAFPRDGIDHSEIFFLIGWLLTPLANQILKTTINHTMNIQSKDLERMPYPWWVSPERKAEATARIIHMVDQGRQGREWSRDDSEVAGIGRLFDFENVSAQHDVVNGRNRTVTMSRVVAQASLF